MIPQIYDDFFPADIHAGIHELMRRQTWQFGWKSNPKTDSYKYFHAHFAGFRKIEDAAVYDCTQELEETHRFLYVMWKTIKHRLAIVEPVVRCYANATPFGSEGQVHTDSRKTSSRTFIYYPSLHWHVNWAGETVFTNAEQSDIVASVYPKPNRLISFPGYVPHIARAVSRTCPDLRVVLVWKSEEL